MFTGRGGGGAHGVYIRASIHVDLRREAGKGKVGAVAVIAACSSSKLNEGGAGATVEASLPETLL